ncbi:MAG: ribonuclease J [Rhodobacteraceae bacterium]|nr:ribonuclease J [Paracoccaceae bacterium]
MAANRMVYMPLGGAGEIGMNLYVYGFGPKGREQLIIVDAGVMFSDMETTPGIDLILPDFSWLEERRQRVMGVFVTHAHEDHLGALGYLHRRVKVPIYARRFTASICQRKLDAEGFGTSSIQMVRDLTTAIEAGPFRVKFVPITHSVPEASALIIESPGGLVLHTGDFKIDEKPLIGEAFDSGIWQRLSKEGISALVCDSTNVFFDREGRSESTIGPALADLFTSVKGAIAATTFASNVSRVRQIAQQAVECGRSVVLLGAAMHRMVGAAVESGVIDDFPKCVDPSEAVRLPRNRLLLLTTGSQGEPRAATAQLSNGKFRGFQLVPGDIVVISSRTIPGNERAVARVVNRFSASGVKVIEDHRELYHVSGHANRQDLTRMQRLLKPKMVVPMHGEHRHLTEHAELAASNGFHSEIVANGSMLDIGRRKIIADYSDQVGRNYLDGNEIISFDTGIVRDRLRMAREGVVMVAVTFGRRQVETEISVRSIGIGNGHDKQTDQLVAETVQACIGQLEMREGPDAVERQIAVAIRRGISHAVGKKPVVRVILSGY